MGTLTNQRHEAFANGLAQGSSISKAYVDAGYRQSPASATRLSKNINVRNRVAELQAAAAERTGVTVESITAELEEARLLAVKEGQTSAAVAASMGKAKLHGLLIDQAVNVNQNYHVRDKPLTEDEWSGEYTQPASN